MSETGIPALSIIIINWNAGNYLHACLEQLGAGALPSAWEIILVDNASTDGSVEAAIRDFPAVRWLQNNRNTGFAAANNQALTVAKGRFVLLLNPDTEADPDTVRAMIAYLQEHPKVGIVGPRLMSSKGRLQGGAAGYDPTPQTIFDYAFFLYQIFPHSRHSLWLGHSFYAEQRPIRVDWVSGAAMMVRREIFQQVGLLDERFFMYVEDIEFCRRVRAAGWQVHVLPMFTVIHHIGRSARQREAAFYAANIKSMDIDYRQRFPPLTVLWLHILGSIGFSLRYLLYTYLYWRHGAPVFAELRRQWSTCVRTSVHLAAETLHRWLS